MERCIYCKYYIKNSETIGECALGSSEDGVADMLTLAYAVDAEAYRAYLVVKPNFGCVQFVDADK